MNSHINNNNENNDNHVFSEDQTFRNVFFDQPKRVTSSASQDPTHIKRARLDSTISLQQAPPSHSDAGSVTVSPASPSTPASAQADDMVAAAVTELEMASLSSFPHESESVFVSTPTCATPVHTDDLPHHTHIAPTTSTSSEVDVASTPSDTVATSSASTTTSSACASVATSTAMHSSTTTKRKRTTSKSPSANNHISHRIRKFRSRSLPNLNYTSTKAFELCTKLKPSSSHAHHHHHTHKSSKVSSLQPPPLPPVNIQSLREIDLTEILKNPQLRHDILFDPQLQFRPNLDGERGRRKKITYDKYWAGVREEIEAYYLNHQSFNAETSRLPNLFITLKEILVSLLPSKDKQNVMEVLDIELILQQLSKNSVDFVELAKWLSGIFKSHCAPMRDSWVDDMMSLFLKADSEGSVPKLVEGLRLIFTILEAMKLDVANHQIRLLRPVLVQTAVDFERDYFMQMISRCKLDITDSVNWFKRCHAKNQSSTPRSSIVPAVLSLLSCSNMVTEFPSSLAFDHARLIVLRANVRQVVCLQLCLALYRQMVSQCKSNTPQERATLLSQDSLNNLKKEILAIITDDNGNVKWTRNIGSIALQLTRRSAPKESKQDQASVDFAISWLIKQTQPSANVYSLMEQRVFNMIAEKVTEVESSDDSSKLNTVLPVSGSNTTAASTPSMVNASTAVAKEEDDLTSIASRIALLTKFHWNVFGTYYTN